MINRRTFLRKVAGVTAASAALPINRIDQSGLTHEKVRSSIRYKVAGDLRNIKISYDAGRQWFHTMTLPVGTRLLDIERKHEEERLKVGIGTEQFTLRSLHGKHWHAISDRVPLDAVTDAHWLGQISMVGFNFNPRSWQACNGNLLPIDSNQALYSLLGTTYGGDGRTTFALPDLRGRVPIHFGQGAGLTNRPVGNRSGSEVNTLSVGQLPAHTHTATSVAKSTSVSGSTDSPSGNIWAPDGAEASFGYGPASALEAMASEAVETTIANTGAGNAVNNMQPYLVVGFVIALQGVFPSRN